MKFSYIIFFTLIVSMCQCSAQTVTENIRINQVGYFCNGIKKAVVVDFAESNFEVWTSDHATKVYSNVLSTSANWVASGETNIKIADFSSLTKEGNYILVIGNQKSYPFTISNSVLNDVTKAQMKFYYYNRCSYELLPQYAGKWARKAGHINNQVKVFEDPTRTVNLSGGWYDAGDFGLYMVTGSIASCELMMAYEQFPEYWNKTEWNIPESGNGVPDILDEVKYELKWLYKMKDTDNGVWYKTSALHHSGVIMPDKETSQFYCMVKNATSAYDYAATFAIAARVFKNYNKQYPGFSDSCLTAAKAAWAWGVANETKYPYCRNPKGVSTGDYGDSIVQSGNDNKVLAGAELFITTKDSAYLKPILQAAQIGFDNEYGEPNWIEKRPLATIELALRGDKLCRENVLQYANAQVAFQNSNPYLVNIGKTPDDFGWGSNRRVSERTISLSAAYLLTKDAKYLQAVTNSMDYILGKNATGYCFITGYGSKQVMFPHHRASGADNVVDPIPGLPIQGPYNGAVGDGCNPQIVSQYAAKNYYDHECSYVTNEQCIDEGSAHIFNLSCLMQYLSK